MPRHQAGNEAPAVRRLGQADAVELLADPDRPRAWTLLVGSTPQSYVDLDDPLYLDFEYVRRLGHLLDLIAPAGTALRVLHLGGGALSLARYVAATRPGSRQLAVDADADLVGLVRERLPLRQPSRRSSGRAGTRSGRISVRVGDAREVMERLPAASFDVVIADLFAAARTPAHVTSVEFAAAARRVLVAGGVFAANVGDGPPLAHARARTASALAVFATACVVADAAVLRGRRFGNLVLAAGDRELPPADLARRVAADPFGGRVVAGDDLVRFVSGVKPITDQYAQLSPVPPPGVFAPS